VIGSLISLIISILQNLDLSAVTAFTKLFYSENNSLILFITFFLIITIIGTFLGSFIGYSGALLLFSAEKNNGSTKFLYAIADCLTRFPALLIGLLAHFIFICMLNMPWHLLTQIMIFTCMLIPSIYDSSNVALKSGTKINEGILLGVVRVWLEFIILIFIIIFFTGNISIPIINISENFGEFINNLALQSIYMDTPKPITNIIVIIITVSLINTLVNWLYKNYAVRNFKKKKDK
jgi:hypothetical protein